MRRQPAGNGFTHPPLTPQGDRRWWSNPERRAEISRDLMVTTVIMLAYFLLRGLRPDAIEASVDRSLYIIRFEQQLGIFHEVRWQEMFLSSAVLVTIANFVYAWLHYPVLLAIALWLVVKDPARFRFVRNVMVVSALVGIVSYWVLPAAPPRLLELHGYDFGFVDTVHGATSNVNYLQPGPFVNDYAAIPSFHFGWIALASAAIWISTTNRWVRVGAVAMSIVMWWAVVVTGNHFFFDMVMGGIVVGFSWIFVAALQQMDFGRLARRLRLLPPETEAPPWEWRDEHGLIPENAPAIRRCDRDESRTLSPSR